MSEKLDFVSDKKTGMEARALASYKEVKSTFYIVCSSFNFFVPVGSSLFVLSSLIGKFSFGDIVK